MQPSILPQENFSNTPAESAPELRPIASPDVPVVVSPTPTHNLLPKRSFAKTKLLIGAIFLVLAAAGGAAAFMLSQSSQDLRQQAAGSAYTPTSCSPSDAGKYKRIGTGCYQCRGTSLVPVANDKLCPQPSPTPLPTYQCGNTRCPVGVACQLVGSQGQCIYSPLSDNFNCGKVGVRSCTGMNNVSICTYNRKLGYPTKVKMKNCSDEGKTCSYIGSTDSDTAGCR